jgi:hypothetical protein
LRGKAEVDKFFEGFEAADAVERLFNIVFDGFDVVVRLALNLFDALA